MCVVLPWVGRCVCCCASPACVGLSVVGAQQECIGLLSRRCYCCRCWGVPALFGRVLAAPPDCPRHHHVGFWGSSPGWHTGGGCRCVPGWRGDGSWHNQFGKALCASAGSSLTVSMPAQIGTFGCYAVTITQTRTRTHARTKGGRNRTACGTAMLSQCTKPARGAGVGPCLQWLHACSLQGICVTQWSIWVAGHRLYETLAGPMRPCTGAKLPWGLGGEWPTGEARGRACMLP